MARSKETKDATKKRKKSFFLVSSDFWAHTLLKVLIAALVAAGGGLALAMAREKALTLSDFQVSPANLEFLSKPDWVTGPIERQLKACCPADKKISLFDGQAAKTIAGWLTANPMIKDVKSVSREFPNRVRAKVDLREPAAFVLRGGKYYIVDTEGVRLPGVYASKAQAKLDLLLIAYVRSSPPPAGKLWNDAAVIQAAKLAAFLKGYKDLVAAAKITAIDSSNIGGRRTPREPEIVLITRDQTKIYWGRGVDCNNVTELSPQRKIENLKKVMAQARGLVDKEYVDIRFLNPVFRRRRYFVGSP